MDLWGWLLTWGIAGADRHEVEARRLVILEDAEADRPSCGRFVLNCGCLVLAAAVVLIALALIR